MLNTRILELLRAPKMMRSEDLPVFESEINKYPYVQNLRALHLFGIKKFSPENYQSELSKTAAYTTDKKILYHFITQNLEEKRTVQQENIQKEEESSTISVRDLAAEHPKTVFETIPVAPVAVPEPVFVKGELNRILFEGEEDFMENETEVIDIESTKEAGQIVTQAAASPEIVTEKTATETVTPDDKSAEAVAAELKKEENFTPETVVNPNEITSVTGTVENASELSFHGLEDFLPEVKITSAKNTDAFWVPKPTANKADEEMQKLIAEVEAKMQRTKKTPEPIVKEELAGNADLNYTETQSFEIKRTETLPEAKKKEEEVKSEKKEPLSGQEAQKIQPAKENKAWKPMNFSGNTPDSLIGKKTTAEELKPQTEEVKGVLPKEVSDEIKAEDRPVFNVSFFTQNVSSIPPKKEEIPVEVPADENKPSESNEASNVPAFINTWQNWLKIDRTEKQPDEKQISKEETKTQVIEKFIEKEPKISQLKEDSNFVVKERGDDISHLMTETLANIYAEQKLYSKAIKAYEILSDKYPERQMFFAEKIQEIKDLRKNF